MFWRVAMVAGPRRRKEADCPYMCSLQAGINGGSFLGRRETHAPASGGHSFLRCVLLLARSTVVRNPVKTPVRPNALFLSKNPKTNHLHSTATLVGIS
jgi:hypothetical protein